jgi:hypothetical protein
MFRRKSIRAPALHTKEIVMRRLIAVLAFLALSNAAWAFPFTYQGSLEDGGAPAQGSYSMTFQLTDSLEGGFLLQSIAVPDVAVDGGVFTVELDFDESHFTGADRFLAVVVNGTSLSPRQQITYAPYAIYSDQAREAGTVRVPLVLNGTTVVIEGYASGSTGVGVRGVHLAGSGTQPGTLGQTHSTSSNAAGVIGEVMSTSAGALSAGVRGINNATGATGIGVYGTQGGSGWGVYGFTPAGRGVFGSSTSGIGVRGSNSDAGTFANLGTDTFAVYGENTDVQGEGTAIEGVGGRVGVRGFAPGAGFGSDLTRIGVQGHAGDFISGAMHLYGVYGFGQAPAGGGGRFAYGVYGTAQSGIEGNTGYGVYGTAVGPGTNWAGYFVGNVHVAGTLSKSAGAFRIDHPMEPETRYLSHSFVESPDMLNIYSGVAVLDDQGHASVKLPRYFEALNTSFRYQLTAVGAAMRDLHVAAEVSGNVFEIAGGSPGGKVSWEVSGVRHDAAARHNPIIVEEDKALADRGKYLNPEAFGAGLDKAVYAGRGE